jgi:transposase
MLAPYWSQVRHALVPLLEEAGLKLTGQLAALARILEIVRVEEFVPEPARGRRGGQTIDRRPIARAFVAKALLNLSQTRALRERLLQSPELRRLCGMEEVPSEPTFCRAFGEFARVKLGQTILAALVEKFVSPQTVTHVSLDSTALAARERAVKKTKPPKVKKRGAVPKRGRSRLPPSRPDCSDRWTCPGRRPCRSCRRPATGG